jgi:hypothetical protein
LELGFDPSKVMFAATTKLDIHQSGCTRPYGSDRSKRVEQRQNFGQQLPCCLSKLLIP